jgi:predicted ATPase
LHIEQVTTKNFGVLENGTYNFVDGMNVIRGGNERGKSTLIEAALYGMFGSGAIRGTLEDAVKEPLKDSELSVEVRYGGYTAKRRKSSASVVGPDTKINGQSAVSQFFYDLLGVRKGNENSTLVSEQGETAGILKGKPGEVSALIEGLADFNQIDDLVENAKAKFPAGNATLLQEILEETKEKLRIKEDVKLTPAATYIAKVTQAEANLKVSEAAIRELNDSINSKKSEIIKIEAGATLKSKLAHDIDTLKKSRKEAEVELETATAASLEDLQAVSAEKELVGGWPEAVQRWDLYKDVTSFGYWKGEEWEGDVESLEAELSKNNGKKEDITTILNDANAEIRSLTRKLNNEDKCPTCGQDTKHIHEEMNAKISSDLSYEEVTAKKAEVDLKEVEENLLILKAIKGEQEKRQQYSGYAADTEILPFNLVWDAAEPIEPSTERFNEARDLILVSETQDRRVKKAKDDVVKLTVADALAEEKLETLQQEYNSTFVQDASDLKGIVNALERAHKDSSEEHDVLSSTVKEAQREADKAAIEAASLKSELVELKGEIESINSRLQKDSRNSEILKQVRKARPKVLNRVWDNVLMTVSATFSDLRGVESVVAKSDKGFTVNGLPVHRLSGSGKSILGISLRVALRDIFSPEAGFIIFDEPADSADKIRTMSIVAALASVRQQVIIITHEGISGLSADNIIDLDD